VRSLPIFRCTVTGAVALAIASSRVEAQVHPPPAPGTPAAVVTPGTRYQAGPVHRFFLGENWRDLWCTPISVPVLDLRTHAGGLTPTEVGGGKETRSLKLKTQFGSE
jgi:hypothetical protein